MSMCTRRCRASTAELCGESNSRWKSAGVRYAEPSAGAARSKSCVASSSSPMPSLPRSSVLLRCCSRQNARKSSREIRSLPSDHPFPQLLYRDTSLSICGWRVSPMYSRSILCQPARRPPSSFAPQLPPRAFVASRPTATVAARSSLDVGRCLFWGVLSPAIPSCTAGEWRSVLGEGRGRVPGTGWGVESPHGALLAGVKREQGGRAA